MFLKSGEASPMSVVIPEQNKVSSHDRINSYITSGGVIVSHSLQHLYGEGFYVILPVIYTALGLTPVAAGFIGTVRQVSSGVASMIGGFLIDQFQHRRKMVLYLSLVVMGLGYLLVGVSSTYLLILFSIGLAGAAGSLWHPAALSLLSQRYPSKRGFMLALHRSSGNAGDALGPIIVGALLLVLTWQGVLFGAFPVAVIMSLLLWIALHRDNGWDQPVRIAANRGMFKVQMASLKDVLHDKELILLLLVSGVAGLGQGSLMLWLPMYLQETQGMDTLGIGFHLMLLSSVGIASGPVIGSLSDRFGRKKVIVIVLLAEAIIATLMALTGKRYFAHNSGRLHGGVSVLT